MPGSLETGNNLQLGYSHIWFTSISLEGLPRMHRLLVTNPYYLNAVDNSTGETALMKAAGRGLFQVTRWLLRQGADLRMTRKGGAQAIHLAALGGHTRVVEFLVLEGGIDPGVIGGLPGKGFNIRGVFNPDRILTPMDLALVMGQYSTATTIAALVSLHKYTGSTCGAVAPPGEEYRAPPAAAAPPPPPHKEHQRINNQTCTIGILWEAACMGLTKQEQRLQQQEERGVEEYRVTIETPREKDGSSTPSPKVKRKKQRKKERCASSVESDSSLGDLGIVDRIGYVRRKFGSEVPVSLHWSYRTHWLCSRDMRRWVTEMFMIMTRLKRKADESNSNRSRSRSFGSVFGRFTSSSSPTLSKKSITSSVTTLSLTTNQIQHHQQQQPQLDISLPVLPQEMWFEILSTIPRDHLHTTVILN